MRCRTVLTLSELETIMTTLGLANVSELAAATAPLMLAISTVELAAIPKGTILIESRRRSTKENPVTDAQRYRAICVPEMMILLPNEAAQSKFHQLLQSKIQELAEARFAEFIKGNPLSSEVSAELFSINALLAYWAEEKKRASMSGEKILAWLKESATFASFTDDKKKAAWSTILPKLAAPGFRAAMTPAQATTVLAQINDSDLEHPTAIFVVNRLNSIMQSAADVDAL